MSKEKPKVLYMTDCSTRSGFGTVAHNVCNALAQDYSTYLLGWGFHYEEPIKRDGYTLIPTGQHGFGADVLPYYLQGLKPEVLIVQADTRMIDWLPDTLKKIQNKPAWLFYVVVDGYVWDADQFRNKWPGNWTAIIKQADKAIAMTQFGQNILRNNGVEAEYIPHGVDTGLFKPMPDKDAIKKLVGLQGKFVVGGVFKNIQRKNPEKYLQAFALFRKGKEEKVALLLHTAPERSMGGEFELAQQCADLGLTVNKDVFFSAQGMPTGQMPLLYNAMDVFWALGSMEGFCLPLIEAMACGAPVVAVNASTFPEILGDTGLLSDIPTYPKSGGYPISYGSYNGVECSIPNPYDIAKKTNMLYESKELRESIAMKQSARVISTYDWNIVKERWREVVRKFVVRVEDLPEEWKKFMEEEK
jgi:glycosyltransferase involved in cell wall biosynthesis